LRRRPAIRHGISDVRSLAHKAAATIPEIIKVADLHRAHWPTQPLDSPIYDSIYISLGRTSRRLWFPFATAPAPLCGRFASRHRLLQAEPRISQNNQTVLVLCDSSFAQSRAQDCSRTSYQIIIAAPSCDRALFPSSFVDFSDLRREHKRSIRRFYKFFHLFFIDYTHVDALSMR
jgi:hypothetical protein